MANKRYDQFSAGTFTPTYILLQANPTTGALEKILLSAFGLQQILTNNPDMSGANTIFANSNLFRIRGGDKTLATNYSGVNVNTTFVQITAVNPVATTQGFATASNTDFQFGAFLGSVGFAGFCKNDRFYFTYSNVGKFMVTKDGRVGIGLNSTALASVLAQLHIAAGTAAAGTAPIKLTAGTNMTAPENGAIEFDGTNLFITVGGTRRSILTSSSPGQIARVFTDMTIYNCPAGSPANFASFTFAGSSIPSIGDTITAFYSGYINDATDSPVVQFNFVSPAGSAVFALYFTVAASIFRFSVTLIRDTAASFMIQVDGIVSDTPAQLFTSGDAFNLTTDTCTFQIKMGSVTASNCVLQSAYINRQNI